MDAFETTVRRFRNDSDAFLDVTPCRNVLAEMDSTNRGKSLWPKHKSTIPISALWIYK